MMITAATRRSSRHAAGQPTREWTRPEQAQQRLRPYVWRRVVVALEALTTCRVQYLQDGYPR
jgi:hypothetical protein